MRLLEVVKKLSNDYLKTTPQRLKIIDAYMLYILLTGIIQFAYCLIVSPQIQTVFRVSDKKRGTYKNPTKFFVCSVNQLFKKSFI